ncbi:hypothetical protein KAR91_22350 [Candidatus Pacearchaeota archaeon]|nr:hypothetical protein [Candidatus Pacearchaeota archaeon]
MDENQFELLMAKLEQIRCCIIDVEEEIKKLSQQINKRDARCSDCGTVLKPTHWCSFCNTTRP